MGTPDMCFSETKCSDRLVSISAKGRSCSQRLQGDAEVNGASSNSFLSGCTETETETEPFHGTRNKTWQPNEVNHPSFEAVFAFIVLLNAPLAALRRPFGLVLKDPSPNDVLKPHDSVRLRHSASNTRVTRVTMRTTSSSPLFAYETSTDPQRFESGFKSQQVLRRLVVP